MVQVIQVKNILQKESHGKWHFLLKMLSLSSPPERIKTTRMTTDSSKTLLKALIKGLNLSSVEGKMRRLDTFVFSSFSVSFSISIEYLDFSCSFYLASGRIEM